jgi:eukaryotic-like serine/threonine-protein kinase
MALSAGTRLGPYEIQSAIGAGGMGEVYRARDPRLGREVAIKVLPAAFSADPDRLRRFEQEARAAAALNHPNILALYDIGAHDGSPYIVSELLDGETLRARLGQEPSRGVDSPYGDASPVTDSRNTPRRLAVRSAIDYAVQMARGLAAAHDKRIVHRDLKPENLFITTDGHLKILDFGLAKLAQAAPALAGASRLPTTPPDTQPGLLVGTIGYAAPEQVRGQTVDYRSDIFAFGAILYEMLSGQRAFAGETAADTVSAVLDKNPADLTLSDRHIPAGLARLVNRCLEKSSAARFQSTRDLTFALEALEIQSSANTLPDPVRARWSRERLAWFVAAASLIVAVAATVMLSVGRAVPESSVSRFEITTMPTDDPVSFALSPDARQLVFLATSAGRSQLWLRSFDSVTPRPIADTDGASYPFWAPDGREVGFFADGKLKRIDLVGGAPRVLADAPIGRGGSWNRDGVIVFAPMATGGLMRIAAAGGPATALTQSAGGQGSHRFPQFLPDGRRFIFLMTQGRLDTRGVYVGALDGGQPTRVLAADTAPVYAAPGYLLVVSRGVLIAYPFDPTRGAVRGEPLTVAQSVGLDVGARGAFSVSETGALVHRSGGATGRRLLWVDRTGKELGVLGPPDESALAGPELAPNGRSVALYRNPEQNVDVWTIDVARGIGSRLTSDAATDSGPVWSSDGSRVFFRSTRNGKFDLFTKLANGASEEQPLLVSGQDKAPQDSSPDGSVLLYANQDPKTGSDLWALPLAGERKPFPVVQTSFDDVQGQFSPDGRWVAYASNETGRYEVYVRPFPGPGGRSPVSTGGGIYPRWRRDGQELYYVTLDDQMMAAPIHLAPDALTPAPGAPVTLFSTRIALSGNVGTGGFASRPQYAVARDGRFLLNVTAEATPPPMTVVLNWPAALKK